ncbi:unnamed protein product [Allacma fusca]|uniref:Uncharacterized protein n=1 Tax=Allacma fusca TaxID=39272 RepID=A0A8J2Q6S3_9HEXA|nr:unnamed protein product [Allacma fusca]
MGVTVTKFQVYNRKRNCKEWTFVKSESQDFFSGSSLGVKPERGLLHLLRFVRPEAKARDSEPDLILGYCFAEYYNVTQMFWGV